MRPMLKPALRRLWRDAETVQLGVDPDTAVILTGLQPDTLAVLPALDGTRRWEDIVGSGVGSGADPAGASHRAALLRLLADAGTLDDGSQLHRGLTDLGRSDRDRLAGDTASLSLLDRAPGAAQTTMARRGAARVAVLGADRVGGQVALLLATAGVGTVIVDDDEPACAADVAPGGLDATGLGAPRGSGVVRRAATLLIGDQRLRHADPDAPLLPLDLAVVAGQGPRPPQPICDALGASGVPYLVVFVRETTAVLGPFVLPGRSACPRCQDLYRAERDPAWPVVAAQLSAAIGPRQDPCDTALAAALAALATLHALCWLDGRGAPPSVDGTIEMALPVGDLRRRSWAWRPDCGCGPRTEPP